MEIKKFKHSNHEFFTIKNNKQLEITLCAYGASIYSIKLNNDYITYHPESIDEFISSTKYYGKSIGRVCGRIKNAEIEIEGTKYKLDINERGNTLHGGIENISFQDFETVITQNDDLINVVFKYTSKDGECGFPGEVRFIIVYSIALNKNKFLIHYHAMSDKVTPINMTTHIYWRLKGYDVLNHELYINANERAIVNEKDQTNIGKTRVDNVFDFRIPKKIGKDIFSLAKREPVSNGYDHCFLIDKESDSQLILKNEGIKLVVKTDMNAINIYTNCYPTGGPIKQYGKDIIYGGIAIEPQMFNTSYKDILIDKDHAYDHYMSFEILENKYE